MEELLSFPKDDGLFPGVAKASSISLSLDDYEDIFSDFDPRPYSERLLSEDFLHELKRASLDREAEGMVLTLWLPKNRRNAFQEKTIRERLKAHFRRHHKRLEEKQRDQKKTGSLMAGAGVVCMFLSTYLLYNFKNSMWSAFVVVLLEPAGWFAFWEGLYLAIFESNEAKPDLAFYRKMTGAKIVFAAPPEPAPPPPADVKSPEKKAVASS